MTVVDTSGVVDFLLGVGVAGDIEAMLAEEGELAAPDLLVFEVLAVLRRETLRGAVSAARAQAAVTDLGDVSLALFPSLTMRDRAWSLHGNLTAADAIFVALAEHLDERFATKDLPLANEATKHTDIEIIHLQTGA